MKQNFNNMQGIERWMPAVLEFLKAGAPEAGRLPLNQIIGFSKNILDGDEPLTENQREQLIHINQWGWRLLAQYNDFLDLSRIETGILDLEFKKVSITDIVQTVVLDFKKGSSNSLYPWRKAIHIEPELPKNSPGIWADSNRIHHILVESIQVFLISGLRANVEIEKLKLSLEYDDSLARIRITHPDEIWLDQEFVTELDRFQTDTPVNKFVIYNVGIFIAFELVRLHNGSMILQNEADVGGSVTILLPTHQSKTD